MKKMLRFNVRRDRDAFGRPEGWFVEDSESKSVLRRFTFRKDAQAMSDEANAPAESDLKGHTRDIRN